MPDDKKKFDLNADLSEARSAFLNDVEVAAEQVKHQMKAAAENEKKQAQAVRSKRISAAVVAAAAVILVLIAYFTVFGKPDAETAAVSKKQYPTAKVQIVDPAAAPQKTAAPTAAQNTAPPKPATHDSQVVNHPQDEYEQPGQDSGM